MQTWADRAEYGAVTQLAWVPSSEFPRGDTLIRRLLLSAALSVLIAACGSGSESSSPTMKVSSPPTAVGSPQVATPTAMIAMPAPSASPNAGPSPVALTSPSPVAVGSPAASPADLASPVAAGSPVAAASPAAIVVTPGASADPNGPRYRIVAERSEASYRARETFVNQPGPSEAVGRTNEVEGELQLDSDGVLSGRVLSMRIDLRTLTSDQSRRDTFIRQNTLRTDQFPFAEFRSTESAGPAVFRPGEEATFQIPGLMTVKGQERPIVWDAQAKLDGATITGTASARVKLTDFGLEPPRLAILSVEDEMTWQIELVAERVP
jgi:polyisoprenoid-binding protein YceI